MKKTLAILICTILCATLLTSCSLLSFKNEEDSKHEHTKGAWIGDVHGHWQPEYCSLDSCVFEPSKKEYHVDNDANNICDICSYEYEYIFKLTFDKSGYELDSIGPGYKGGNVVIPAEHNGLPVTEIGYGAFKSDDYKLTSIAIPDSVTLIDDDAFQNQTSLSNIIVGKNVVTIGVSAFEGCTNLQTVIIGDATENIYAHAFDGCTALESVILGKNIKKIGGSAFEECTSLKTITIPASIEELGAWVFYESNITNIYFGVSAPSEKWSENWNQYLDESVNIHWAKSKECNHQWDGGVEIEGGIGAYGMEYTCLLCGEKTQEIIFIIPPEGPEECYHQWDGGVEIEGGVGGYITEYTCLLCGEKTQEIITIIPPEGPEECYHQWDDGVEIESGVGGYITEYTCLLCGEKTQEIITIIPPEGPES